MARGPLTRFWVALWPPAAVAAAATAKAAAAAAAAAAATRRNSLVYAPGSTRMPKRPSVKCTEA